MIIKYGIFGFTPEYKIWFLNAEKETRFIPPLCSNIIIDSKVISGKHIKYQIFNAIKDKQNIKCKTKKMYWKWPLYSSFYSIAVETAYLTLDNSEFPDIFFRFYTPFAWFKPEKTKLKGIDIPSKWAEINGVEVKQIEIELLEGIDTTLKMFYGFDDDSLLWLEQEPLTESEKQLILNTVGSDKIISIKQYLEKELPNYDYTKAEWPDILEAIKIIAGTREDKNYLPQTTQQADNTAQEPQQEKPADLVTFNIALRKYKTSRATLQRAIKEKKLKSYRPENAPENAPHLVSKADLDRLYPDKKR